MSGYHGKVQSSQVGATEVQQATRPSLVGKRTLSRGQNDMFQLGSCDYV
jgi:hypothetical protein